MELVVFADGIKWVSGWSADAIAAGAGLASAVISFGAAVIAFGALRRATDGIKQTAIGIDQQIKIHDFATLRQFGLDIRDAEDRLLKANVESSSKDGEERFNDALVDYLNLFEVYAAGVNHGLIEKVTANIVRERLTDDLARMLEKDRISDGISRAITSTTTFAELRAYKSAHHTAIEKIRNRLRIEASEVPAQKQAAA